MSDITSPFDIHEMWKKYVEKTGLTNAGVRQYGLHKKTFYAGCEMMLNAVRHDIPELQDDDLAIAALDDMMEQIVTFWQKSNHRMN